MELGLMSEARELRDYKRRLSGSDRKILFNIQIRNICDKIVV